MSLPPWAIKLLGTATVVAFLAAALAYAWKRGDDYKAQLSIAQQANALLSGQLAYETANRQAQDRAYQAVLALQQSQEERIKQAQGQRQTIIKEVRISDPDFAQCLDQPVPAAYIRGMRAASGDPVAP